MGKALYRKYRSKSLAEIVGQEHITDTLAKALKSGRISHAYLFSGPRGVGKTSIARILAHEINDLPYTDDSSHLDIIEIDAASNRRIDEIRDLRDKVYIAPTSGKYKVYIIDEVHMLTREAFNALLKTLEEPPAHAVFILATTEAHKLPDTIISRTQHYTFKPVERQKVIDHLGSIAKQENITITTDALDLLAAHGQGSFRDSISLLDQASGMEDAIDAPEIRRLLGIAPDSALDELIQAIHEQRPAGMIITITNDLYSQGLQAAAIASQLAEKLRAGLANNTPVLPVDISLRLMRELIEVPSSHNPERLLEIILLGSLDNAITPVATPTVRPAPAPKAAPVVAPSSPVAKANKPSPIAPPEAPPKIEPVKVAPQTPEPEPVSEPAASPIAAPPTKEQRAFNETVWPEVLNSIKKQYNTLYGVLRMANPIFQEDSIELQFKFAFHQKRLNEVKNRKIIADFIKEATGKDISVNCTYNKDATPAPNAAANVAATPAVAPALDSISDIFGGGEVLHS
ncbi:MAG: polymerase subunit gamma/tau [Candidatus Saccharibacteria bacterium]|nr:polymerase subunit gamma/tau [Candidatus Saccharibacteria bacterium]